MKKITIFVLTLFGALIINSNLLASHDKSGADTIIAEEMPQLQSTQMSSGITEISYKTWTVMEVTDDTIILQRKKRNGKTNGASIDRSRRPYLKEGDKVRYDKARNRLRRTLEK